MFVRQMQKCVNARQVERRALASISHCVTVYETDLQNNADRQRVCDELFRALGVAPYVVHTTRSRSWNRPYCEMVGNFAELETLMQTAQGLQLQANWDRLFSLGGST